jgi:tetratricopeptide (TPR) repeat protein
MAVELTAPATFRTFIVRAAYRALQRTQPNLARLDEETRLFVFHALTYALQLEEAWSPVRDLLLALAPRMEQAGYRHDWMAYLEQGIAQSRVLRDRETEAELRFHLGVLYHHQGHLQEARREFEDNQEAYRAAGDAHRQGRARNRLAQTARSEGHLEEAAGHALAALKLVGTDPVESGFTQMVLGTIAYDQQAWERCVEHFRTSLHLWETGGDLRRVPVG